jgi:hypothetical protein
MRSFALYDDRVGYGVGAHNCSWGLRSCRRPLHRDQNDGCCCAATALFALAIWALHCFWGRGPLLQAHSSSSLLR